MDNLYEKMRVLVQNNLKSMLSFFIRCIFMTFVKIPHMHGFRNVLYQGLVFGTMI